MVYVGLDIHKKGCHGTVDAVEGRFIPIYEPHIATTLKKPHSFNYAFTQHA